MLPVSAKFDVAKNNGSVFSNSLRNDVVMFAGNPSQHILIGAKQTNSNGNVMPSSISIDTSSNSPMTEFRTPVDMNQTLHVKGDLFLTNGGSLGVGKTNPSEKVDVVGNVKAIAFIGDGSQLTGVAKSADVTGPSSATSNAITRFDGTTGKLIDSSLVTIDDSGVIRAPSVGSLIPFYFSDTASFPSASNYHGAIAHAHDPGYMYYAHGGEWKQLANDAILKNVKMNDAATTLSVGYNSTIKFGVEFVV